ncbi:ankyrin repeat domain-containing protein 52, partial [Fusarium austroafricanum]
MAQPGIIKGRCIIYCSRHEFIPVLGLPNFNAHQLSQPVYAGLKRDSMLNNGTKRPTRMPKRKFLDSSAMGHLKVVKTLITYGANVNEVDPAGYSPIHYATRNNHTSVVALLLENGADIYSLDPEGCTPLYRAAQKGNNEIVERLLKHGAQ